MVRGMNKIVLVRRRTRLEELKRRYNTIEQARFYVEHLGADFNDYIEEHENYYRAFEKVRTYADQNARVQEIDRDYIPNMIFGKEDVVIAVGQDGLVANINSSLSDNDNSLDDTLSKMQNDLDSGNFAKEKVLVRVPKKSSS